MSNLIPEPRVNKNGVSVIKHVRAEGKPRRAGFLSSLIPKLNGISSAQRKGDDAKRKVLIDALKSDVSSEKEETRKADKAAYDNRHTLDPIDRRYVETTYLLDQQREAIERMQAEVESEIKSKSKSIHLLNKNKEPVKRPQEPYYIEGLNKLSTGTIKLIHDAFSGTGEVHSFLLGQDFDDEERVRTHIVFKDAISIHSYYLDKILPQVRESLGTADLSHIEEGTAEHYAVAAVFRAALALQQRPQHEVSQGDPLLAARRLRNKRLAMSEEEKKPSLMSPQLAEVTMEYPDRVDDIVNYLAERGVTPQEVDTEHLRLYLDNPSPVLAEGTL